MLRGQISSLPGIVSFASLFILTAQVWIGSASAICNFPGCVPEPVGTVAWIPKTHYHPNETVPITVNSDTITTVYLTIRDGMDSNGPDNAKILYSTKLELTNRTCCLSGSVSGRHYNTASVNYTVPEDNKSIYRYFVVVSEDVAQVQDGKYWRMFFSEQDADKIIIEDFVVDTSQFRPGGKLFFHAKVLDGVGNPQPIWGLHIYPYLRDAQRPDFLVGGILADDLVSGFSNDEKRQYSLDGSFSGYIPISQDMPHVSYYVELGVTDIANPETAYANSPTYDFPSPGPSDKQLLECKDLGISNEECSNAAIAQKRGERWLSDEERERMKAEQDQINNSIYLVGSGAAIAGAIAFITLRKRKQTKA